MAGVTCPWQSMSRLWESHLRTPWKEWDEEGCGHQSFHPQWMSHLGPNIMEKEALLGQKGDKAQCHREYVCNSEPGLLRCPRAHSKHILIQLAKTLCSCLVCLFLNQGAGGLHCEFVHTGISTVHFWNILTRPLQSDGDTARSSKDLLSSLTAHHCSHSEQRRYLMLE